MIPPSGLASFRGQGRNIEVALRENIPGSFPYTGERVSFQAAGRGSGRGCSLEKAIHSGQTAGSSISRPTVRPSDCPLRLTRLLFTVEIPRKDLIFTAKWVLPACRSVPLDDVKELYAGFDLSSPNTSVSMTINGPAPMMLAMFFNAGIEQQMERFRAENGSEPSREQAANIKADVLQNIRGTVQADILKEDQGQNTCIFSIDFALKMMGDIQEYFIKNNVRNFYSVSISGYHIAEAGANPITQLAFTLANGFTYVEYYFSRGMHIDDFAPNLSFFFSSGLEPEYSVIGRVARRIWAVAMREKYGANERSQKLKYHIQTSGRSLHAQEIQFNDIRTTLQALIAVYDNCNSLHTNAYDEAITTPTEESFGERWLYS